MKYSIIIILLAHVYTVLPAAHAPVDYGPQMLMMAMLVRFEGPHNHEPRRVRRGNVSRGTYDQQDRQSSAQQKKSNKKNCDRSTIYVNDRRQLPRKFNHIPCGNKPQNKVRYR